MASVCIDSPLQDNHNDTYALENGVLSFAAGPWLAFRPRLFKMRWLA